jgi:hypothetical protein
MATKSRTLQLIINGKDKVSKVLKGISSKLKSWGAGALKITGAAAAGFSLVGVALSAIYSKFANLIDQQAKVASSIGMANEKLGVYYDAAGYAGVETAALNTSLKKMSQNIGDAAAGTGDAVAALEALGLSAEDLQKKGPAAAFEAIIAKLDELPNGIKKTTLAMDLFGKSGAAMTNLTSSGLKQAQKDADALGLKLSSAQAGGVEAANDAWARIKNASADFLKYVTAKIAPSVNSAFTKMFEWMKTVDLKAWASKAALAIATAFKNTIIVLGGVTEAIIAITRGMVQAFTLTNQIIGGLAALKTVNAEDKLAAIRAEIERMENSRFSYMNGPAIERLKAEEVTAKKELNRYKPIADGALKVDATLDGSAAWLKNAQGFSQSKEVTGAIGTLERLVADLEADGAATQGRVDAHAKVAAAAEAAVASEVSGIDTLIAKYNELNKVKLTGGAGTYSTVSSLSALADSLEDDDL